MPARAYKAGGMKHARTASGGSSKMGLNLHFTQKEPTHPVTGHARTAAKTVHNGHTDTHASRGKDPQRTHSAVRLDKGKERDPTPMNTGVSNAVRRTSSGRGQTRPKRGKAGFAIASPSTGDDDSDEEEWLSSEAPSGAATPHRTQSDSESESSEDPEDGPPVMTMSKLRPETTQTQKNGTGNSTANQTSPLPPVSNPALVATPKPHLQVLPTAIITNPTPTEEFPPSNMIASTQMPSEIRRQRTPSPPRPHRRAPSPPSTRHTPTSKHQQIPTPDTPPNLAFPPPASPSAKHVTRSATTSPIHADHTMAAPNSTSRQALTRPPSTHSVASVSHAPLRPHPLIRAHSHGKDALAPGTPRAAPLTTATTRTGTPVSISPPRSLHHQYLQGTRVSSSPESVSTVDGGAAPMSPAFARPAQSISSLASAPAPEFSVPGGPRLTIPADATPAERKRTLSAMSTASGASLAALASLAGHTQAGHGSVYGHGHSHSGGVHRPPPLPMTVHFPPPPPIGSLEAMHPLLPQPYLSQHMSALKFADPMRESYARTMRAKHGW